MMRSTDASLLRTAASRVGCRPGFLGYELARYRELTGTDPGQMFGLDGEGLDRLALCRTPRQGEHFGHDVMTISTHIGCSPVALAGLARLTEVLPSLHALASTDVDTRHAPGMLPKVLAAARDDVDEHTVLPGVDQGLASVPGWLREAVEHFWAIVPGNRSYPRDLDLAVLVGLPVAMVEMTHLSLRTLARWLEHHDLAVDLPSGEDRRLRACLVALDDVGLMFVDAGDDPTQRRVSLAHEAAHFIVEYALPRREVARRRPELLDVVDGRRSPTRHEQLSAVLADVPIGVHAHLLDRTSRGYYTDERASQAEWRARRVALELLAPQEVVLDRLRRAGASDVTAARKLLIHEFGLPVSLAEDYAGQLLRLVTPLRPGLLDLFSGRGALPCTDGSSGDRDPSYGKSSGCGRSAVTDPEEN